jgi:hypothetical protein
MFCIFIVIGLLCIWYYNQQIKERFGLSSILKSTFGKSAAKEVATKGAVVAVVKAGVKEAAEKGSKVAKATALKSVPDISLKEAAEKARRMSIKPKSLKSPSVENIREIKKDNLELMKTNLTSQFGKKARDLGVKINKKFLTGVDEMPYKLSSKSKRTPEAIRELENQNIYILRKLHEQNIPSENIFPSLTKQRKFDEITKVINKPDEHLDFVRSEFLRKNKDKEKVFLIKKDSIEINPKFGKEPNQIPYLLKDKDLKRTTNKDIFEQLDALNEEAVRSIRAKGLSYEDLMLKDPSSAKIMGRSTKK